MNAVPSLGEKHGRFQFDIPGYRNHLGNLDVRSVEPVLRTLAQLSQVSLEVTMQQTKPITIQLSDNSGVLLGQLTLPAATKMAGLEVLRTLGIWRVEVSK